MQKPIILAISGASGSGKSLFTQNLRLKLEKQNQEVLVLQEDHYYKSQDHIPQSERAKTNYDHPDAFEHDLLQQHLISLCAGKTIDYPSSVSYTHLTLPTILRV